MVLHHLPETLTNSQRIKKTAWQCRKVHLLHPNISRDVFGQTTADCPLKRITPFFNVSQLLEPDVNLVCCGNDKTFRLIIQGSPIDFCLRRRHSSHHFHCIIIHFGLSWGRCSVHFQRETRRLTQKIEMKLDNDVKLVYALLLYG